jgi:hypothetical protein
MTLDEFIELYDRPGVVLLFFGKRELPLDEAVRVHNLGKLLISKTQHILFRSGNAQGADEKFINGVADVDRVQLIIPWNGHRATARVGYHFYSLDDLTILNEDRAAYTAFTNQPNIRLVTRYIQGYRDRTRSTSAPIIRDAVMVVGHGDIPPATVALYWDDLSEPETGGTGVTLGFLRFNEIAAFNQEEWGSWV